MTCHEFHGLVLSIDPSHVLEHSEVEFVVQDVAAIDSVLEKLSPRFYWS